MRDSHRCRAAAGFGAHLISDSVRLIASTILATPIDPLKLRDFAGAAVPRTFVECTAKPACSPLDPVFAAMAARVRAAGWEYRTLAADHWPPPSKPREVADLLQELA